MYATLQDLKLRFGERELAQLTDRADPPSGFVDEAVAADALGYAEALITGTIGVRYKLPLTQAQPVLREAALDLAWWRLQREPTEEARRRYEAAMSTLSRIGKGEIVLAGEAGAAAEPAERTAVVQMESQPRLFSRDRMAGL